MSSGWVEAVPTGLNEVADPGGVLLGFLRCVGVEGRNSVYVSVPITTGREFAAWFSQQPDAGSDAYRSRLHREVVQPNLKRARPLVQQVRDRWSDMPVIDPTGLDDVPGWTQADYHAFWVQIVLRHAALVVLAEGWQYSNGCALEVAAAVRSGADLLDHHLEPMNTTVATRLLREAIDELDDLSVDSSTLRYAATTMTTGRSEGAVS